MYESFYKKKSKSGRRILSAFVAFAFFLGLLTGPASQAQAQYISNLPKPGEMVLLSTAYEPAVLKGMTLHPENPLLFDFLVDRGQDNLSPKVLKDETQKLLKYFLAAMTLPDKDSWVNLSPYESDRIIPDLLGSTDMGKTMLEQDYLLKQLSASLTNPQQEIGKKFWDTVYKKTYEKFGTTAVPINTFNKVWIIPDRADVVEDNGTVFIAATHLKVMLDEDYTSVKENLNSKKFSTDQISPDKVEVISGVSSAVVREIIIPELEKEINTGKNFAQVRQIYNSVILATWYKKTLKDSLLGKVYVDKSKISGVDIAEKDIKQKVYEQYLEAFRKGVYNLIKEDYDLASKETLPRKYFSGGFTWARTGQVLRSSSASSSIGIALIGSVPTADILGRTFRAGTLLAEPGERKTIGKELEKRAQAETASASSAMSHIPLTSSQAAQQIAIFLEKNEVLINGEFAVHAVASTVAPQATLKISPLALLVAQQLLLELSYEAYLNNGDRVIFGTKGFEYKEKTYSGGVRVSVIFDMNSSVDLASLNGEKARLFIALVADRMKNSTPEGKIAHSEYWTQLKNRVGGDFPSVASSAVHSPLKNMRLLYVEDDRTNQMFFDIYVGGYGAGAKVTIAATPDEARELIQKAKDAGTPFDAYVLDNNLGVEVTGLELSQNLIQQGDKTPTVFISTDLEDPNSKESLALAKLMQDYSDIVKGNIFNKIGGNSPQGVQQLENLLFPPSSSVASSAVTVLLVDSSRLVETFLLRQLKASGYTSYTIRRVGNAKEVLPDMATNGGADIVIATDALDSGDLWEQLAKEIKPPRMFLFADESKRLSVEQPTKQSAVVFVPRSGGSQAINALVDKIVLTPLPSQTPVTLENIDLRNLPNPIVMDISSVQKTADGGQEEVKTKVVIEPPDTSGMFNFLYTTPTDPNFTAVTFQRGGDGIFRKADNVNKEFIVDGLYKIEVNNQNKIVITALTQGGSMVSPTRIFTEEELIAVLSAASGSSSLGLRKANATSVTQVSKSDVGGIDFDPSLLNLQIKRNGRGVPLPLPEQNLEKINLEGLYPFILYMEPATVQNLPFLSHASQ